MMINVMKVREKSLSAAEKFGFDINKQLPTIELTKNRDISEIIGRTLALYAVVAVSYGLDRKDSIKWLKKEFIYGYLSNSEIDYLLNSTEEDGFFNRQVESLNVFAWSLFLVETIDFSAHCSSNLVSKFPDILKFENSKYFKKMSKLRDYETIYEFCDLSYCLHWAFVENPVDKRRNSNVEKHVVIERRRALEWLISDVGWDELSLDT